MKILLILIACFYGKLSLAQEHTEIQKLKNPFKLERNKISIFTDSGKLRVFPYTKDVMPNAFIVPLPQPKFAGNNGRGQDIYVLPLDNMPMIRPDSTYVSTMPVAGRMFTSRTKN